MSFLTCSQRACPDCLITCTVAGLIAPVHCLYTMVRCTWLRRACPLLRLRFSVSCLCVRCAAGDPVVMPTVAASDAAEEQTKLHNDAQLTLAASRRADDRLSYAVDCWMPRSAFTNASCNCLAEAAHPKLGARRTVNVVVGSWYASVTRPSRFPSSADVVSGSLVSCGMYPNRCFASHLVQLCCYRWQIDMSHSSTYCSCVPHGAETACCLGLVRPWTPSCSRS
jgi:hypothetical protein